MSFARRKDKRYDLEMSGHLTTVANDQHSAKPTGQEVDEYAVVSKDISSGGALFSIDSTLAEDAQVEIDLELPLQQLKELQGKTARISLSGKVIRIETDSVAVRFDKAFKVTSLQA